MTRSLYSDQAVRADGVAVPKTKDSAVMTDDDLSQFVEPTTVDEAQERQRAAVASITMIDTQLSNRNRLADGHRMTPTQYHAWRVRALQARAFRVIELQNLKAWIRRWQPRHTRAAANLDEPPATGGSAIDWAVRVLEPVAAVVRHVAELETQIEKMQRELNALRERGALDSFSHGVL